MATPVVVSPTEDTASRAFPIVGNRPRLRIARAFRGPAALVLYVALYLVGIAFETPYWHLPAGVRFALLWLIAPRRWFWLAAADLVAASLAQGATLVDASMLASLLDVFATWSCTAAVVALARLHAVYAAPEAPGRMGNTLLAMAASGALAGLVHAGVLWLEHRITDQILFSTAMQFGLRDYVGMLLLAPVAFQFASPHAHEHERRRVFAELALVFVPLIGLVLALTRWWPSAVLYAAVLAVAPLMAMSFRHGWRGAAWSLIAVGLLSYLMPAHILAPLPAEAPQLYIAIVGSVALLLGAAIGSLRRLNAALVERNRQELATSARLSLQASELRELGQRLARAREDEQGRLAHELHDELGQTLTALGTRIGLLLRRSDDPEMISAMHAQRELVRRMGETLREVLHGLRPALLDRFGLEAALREGPLQRLLSDAGVDYEVAFSGPVARLGADAASAIYRISQEAATNCVRHARASRFRLAVDIDPTFDGSLEVHLRIEDDGRGFDCARVADETRSSGLSGIRDRVQAMGGESSCESGADGTRHTIWFVDRAPGTGPAVRSS